ALRHLPSFPTRRSSDLWVYAEQGHNFVNTMQRLMHERETLSVVHDQIGSPTYAGDLARAIITILKAKHWTPGIYHYANEGEVSWYDFAVAIREQIGASCQIQSVPTSEYPTPARRPSYSLLDKSKIKRTFNVSVPFWLDSLTAMRSEERRVGKERGGRRTT